MGCQKGRACNMTVVETIRKMSRDLVPEAEVEQALAALGSPYSVRYTSAHELSSPWPRMKEAHLMVAGFK